MRRLLVPCLVLALVPHLAFGESAGVDSRQEFPPLGCGSAETGEGLNCHFQNADPELIVSIVGEPTIPGLGDQFVQLYTASIPPQQIPLLGAGINVAIDPPNAPGCVIEAFAPLDKLVFQNDSLDPSSPVLSHAGNQEPPDNLIGQWAYQFLVGNCTAPGSLIVRVAMNAFNYSGDEDGDAWNSTQIDIAVPEPGAAALGSIALAALALRRRR